MRPLSPETARFLKPIKLNQWDILEIAIDKEWKHFIVRITTNDEDQPIRHWPSKVACWDFVQRIPERKELKDSKPHTWLLAVSDYTAEIIRALWPEDRLRFRSDDAEMIYHKLLLTAEQQDLAGMRYAAYKALGSIPDAPIEVHQTFPLASFQRACASITYTTDGYAYFMEQGCGKTPTLISLICSKAATREWQEPYKAIIVAPKNVKHNWFYEFEKFATQPGKISIVDGTAINRIGELLECMLPEEGCKYNVAIISYDAMVRSIDVIETLRWDLAALDEAHAIKSPETKRAKASWRLRDVARQRIILTGTPVCNTPLDLYSLFEFMGEGYSGFRSWKNFKKFYGVYDAVDGDAVKRLVGVQNLPFMKERLARLSFFITKKEALPELPDKVYDTYEVEMSQAQRDAYEKIAEDLILEIENELNASENNTMTVNHVLTRLLRLAQIACGFVTWDAVYDPASGDLIRAKSIEWFNDDPKIDALLELHREKEKRQKTIIWSCFVPCIHKISERFTAEGIEHVTFYGATSDSERLEAQRRFNADSNVRYFIGNPAAGGVGMNLPGSVPQYWDTTQDTGTDADHVIYYSQDWSYMKRAQSEDRNHGKFRCRTNIRYTDLVVPNTIDHEIRLKVDQKKLVALQISDVREILQNIVQSIGVKA